MSSVQPVRVGIIGLGFGARVVAPMFKETEGCEVVDVVSPRDDAAVNALCARADVDVISVHSPPFLHLGHVRRAIEAGHAVACDKPFGRNAGEAAAMHDLAAERGVINVVNFEFRYDPVRERLRSLVKSGAVGDPVHFHSTMFTAHSRKPLRPYGWLFDQQLGGGWLGAFGSHLIDFARWTFGEIVAASAELRTTIAERPDAAGELHTCSADDGFVATLRSDTGVTIVIDSTFAAPVTLPPHTVVIGTDGVLEVEGDRRIILHTADGGREEFEPSAGNDNLYLVPVQRWAAAVRDAVRSGAVEPGTPVFADGVACAKVMDELRR
jgi:predicted dehydrogenase